MRKNILIETLTAIEGNPDVLITNWAENLADDTGDGSGAGMYSSFSVSLEPNGSLEPEPGNENFIALAFDDASRDENGVLIEPYLIALDELDSFKSALSKHISLKGSLSDEDLEGYYKQAVEKIQGEDEPS